jgi:hypothetical protein
MLSALSGQTGTIGPSGRNVADAAPDRPQEFYSHPAGEPYRGPVAQPKLGERDASLRPVFEDGPRAGPNFAARYAIVRFQTGKGPVGAGVLDAKTGLVFHLPTEVARDGYFIDDTDCLAERRKWRRLYGEKDEDSDVLSFAVDSELLIVRRCLGSGRLPQGVEKTYFQWHAQRWRLLTRIVLPPPPPEPIQ